MGAGALRVPPPAPSTAFEGAMGQEFTLRTGWPLKEAECEDGAGNTLTFCAKCVSLRLAEDLGDSSPSPRGRQDAHGDTGCAPAAVTPRAGTDPRQLPFLEADKTLINCLFAMQSV